MEKTLSSQVLPKEKVVWMYRKMVEIRQFEDAVHRLFAAGKLAGFVHLHMTERIHF